MRSNEPQILSLLQQLGADKWGKLSIARSATNQPSKHDSCLHLPTFLHRRLLGFNRRRLLNPKHEGDETNKGASKD
jgi:hypothetical protein